ncbi:DUF494 family protein [Plasticicumulans acidivorans]|uniref:Protein Smg homolog n=1 Tax=Plasticicumulans acidivorans TaxID=886464 RepID=A0A317MY23_9GAMM|nr:DUF494 domain-containing protein [Plasticicumulans acidivorans]PWV64599.1 Smg protein [Plasticicumulans acidivorans]
MKENVLDVLMYLFQNFISEDIDADSDRESMRSELIEAGFATREVKQAFEWLDSLVERQQDPAAPVNTDRSFRIFTAEECVRLDVECRGLLMQLEQVGVLSPMTRELVMDRVMALDTDEIDSTQLKWLIMMVLFHQPGQEDAYAAVEDLLFDDVTGYLH